MRPTLTTLAALALLTPRLPAQTYPIDRLIPAAVSPDDLIGAAVDVDGDRLVLGGYGHDAGGVLGTGGVWVYDRGPGGVWGETAFLLPTSGVLNGRFGRAVAISGDVVAVGSPRDDTAISNGGAVHVFTRQPDGTWLETQELYPSDVNGGAEFGSALDLDGDRLAVGAPGATFAFTTSGAGYVFERQPDGSFLEVAKVAVDDSLGNDELGTAIALDGDRLVMGSERQDDNGNSSGAAYVFDRDGAGAWNLEVKLLASDGASFDGFGSAVGVAGDVVAVGARRDDDAGSGSGAVYVFERVGAGLWDETQKLLHPDAGPGDQLGASLALDGDTLVAGAPFENPEFKTDAGQAHLWRRGAAGFAYEATLSDVEIDSDENFGQAVAVDGGTVLVGSPDNDQGASNGGLARLFFHAPSGPDPAPATVGSGTPGCGGPLVLGLNLPPRIDTAGFALEATGCPPSSAGFLFLGTASNPGVDIGFGIQLHVDPFLSSPLIAFTMTSDADGLGTTPLPLPDAPGLVGASLTAQAVFAWTSCALPPFGLSSSNGVEFTVLD